MEGVGWHHINVRDGRRVGTYAGYLEPAMSRPNLTVSTNSMAARLVLTDGRCTGVEYIKDGQTVTDTARKEVIVCGGALESPKLLMLSGIGPLGPPAARSASTCRSTCPAWARTSTTTCWRR